MASFELRNTTPTTWNSHAINDGTNYIAKFPVDMPITPVISSVVAMRSNDFPVFGAKEFKGRSLPIEIQIVGGSMSELVTWFDPSEKTQYKLTVTNANDASVWYVYGVVNSIPRIKGRKVLIVMLDIFDPVWRNNTGGSSSWSITASGDTKVVTPGGNRVARPVFTITPTGARSTGGYLYKRFAMVYNPSTKPMPNYGLDITSATGAALSTSGLVNDTTVSNQINQGGGIDAVVTTIPIDTAVGGGLPAAGMGYCGTEQISWTANSGTSLTGVTRGIGGTTAATHADNAVIARSKVLANGNDMRFFINGAESNRWVGGGGWNTSTTGVWININLDSGINLTLLGALSDVGAIATIPVAQTAANLASLKLLGACQNKLVVIKTGSNYELFTYTGVDLTLYTITGCTRSAKGSTAIAHTAADNIYWVQYDIWLTYGNSGAGTPDIDDTKKPLLNLTSSTNLSHVQTDYYDSASPNRPFSWRPSIISRLGTNSKDYGANHATNFDYSAVASEMGMQIKSWAMGNQNKAETAQIAWVISHPAGLTTVSTSGEKYRTTSTWVTDCALQYSADGNNWTNAWNEATPASATSWTAFTQNSIALGATYYVLRYMFNGSQPASTGATANMEVDSITLVPASGGVPIVSLLAEVSQYYLSFTLANSTTGKSFTVTYPAALNKILTINCDTSVMTYDDGSVVAAALKLSDKRAEWLTLNAGSNTLTYTDTGTGNVTIDIAWEERSL